MTTARGWPTRFGAHRELDRGYRMHFVPSANDAPSLRKTWPKIQKHFVKKICFCGQKSGSIRTDLTVQGNHNALISMKISKYSQVGSNGAGPKHIFAHKNKTCFEVFLYEDFVTTARGWPTRFGAHRELDRGYRKHFVLSANDVPSLRNTWPKIQKHFVKKFCFCG